MKMIALREDYISACKREKKCEHTTGDGYCLAKECPFARYAMMEDIIVENLMIHDSTKNCVRYANEKDDFVYIDTDSKLSKFFTKLFCKHEYVKVGFREEYDGNMRYSVRHYVCKKCRKSVWVNGMNDPYE